MFSNRSCVAFCLVAVVVAASGAAAAVPDLLADAPVQAGGAAIDVPGYSVPTFADWNADGRADLIVGEGGGGTGHAKVRVYLDGATSGPPQFGAWFYAQADGADLDAYSATACLGAFPRVVYWDADDRKDLLVGIQDGRMKLYRNVATDQAPAFDAGTFVQIFDNAQQQDVDLDVGDRTTSTFADWDQDGLNDIVSGAYDGKVHVFRNVGAVGAPAFDDALASFAQDSGADLLDANYRSSPHLFDLDGDGRRDLVLGDTTGQVRFYPNVNTDAAPAFDGFSLLQAGGVDIDLPDSARSRPFVCDFNHDGTLDVLVGGGDGLVHYYQGVPAPATLALLTAGGLTLLRRRGRR